MMMMPIIFFIIRSCSKSSSVCLLNTFLVFCDRPVMVPFNPPEATLAAFYVFTGYVRHILAHSSYSLSSVEDYSVCINCFNNLALFDDLKMMVVMYE